MFVGSLGLAPAWEVIPDEEAQAVGEGEVAGIGKLDVAADEVESGVNGNLEAAGEGVVAGVGVAGVGAVVLVERAAEVEGPAVEAEVVFVGLDAAEAGGEAAGVRAAVGIEGDVDVVEGGRGGIPELDAGPVVADLQAGVEVASGFAGPEGRGTVGFPDVYVDSTVGVRAAEDGQTGRLEVFGEVGSEAGDVVARALIQPDGLPEARAFTVPVLFAARDPGGAG